MKTNNPPKELRRKNRTLALSVLVVVILMIGLSFAAVPLYDLFCRTTGFGGTTQVSQAAPEQILDRIITVRFNTDTARDLPWNFAPDKRGIDVKIGQKSFISFSAKNKTNRPVAGTALYNVSPPKAGQYFHKIECFCFAEQILGPNQKTSMPVMFYLDPSLADDPSMEDVKTITLSYSFFKTESEALEQALEDFYNQPAGGEPPSKQQPALTD